MSHACWAAKPTIALQLQVDGSHTWSGQATAGHTLDLGLGLSAGGRVIMMDDFAWLRELLARIRSTRARLQRWNRQRSWDSEEGAGLISSAAGHTE